jgi:Family of unknown function (DUF6788)
MARNFDLQHKSTLALRRRKRRLLQELRPPPDLLRASYVEQFLTCGKPACACHRGQKHGPYYYLTLSLGAGQVRKFLLKGSEQQEQARRGTAAYSQFAAGLEELSQINAELLRRGESLLSSG